MTLSGPVGRAAGAITTESSLPVRRAGVILPVSPHLHLVDHLRVDSVDPVIATATILPACSRWRNLEVALSKAVRRPDRVPGGPRVSVSSLADKSANVLPFWRDRIVSRKIQWLQLSFTRKPEPWSASCRAPMFACRLDEFTTAPLQAPTFPVPRKLDSASIRWSYPARPPK
jgi:hypothetical protein